MIFEFHFKFNFVMWCRDDSSFLSAFTLRLHSIVDVVGWLGFQRSSAPSRYICMYSRPLRRPDASFGYMGCGSRVRVAVPVAAAGGRGPGWGLVAPVSAHDCHE